MQEESTGGDLITSILISVVLIFLLPNSMIEGFSGSLMRDGSMLTGTRYTINQDALDSIAEDAEISIIGIGSSQMFKALDGRCVSDNLSNGTMVYNIAQSSSRPYTDMLHIPRIVNSNPEILLIEISPNLLGNTSIASKEYIELRFKLDTMNQDSSDLGGWVDIIDPEHKDWVALDNYERMIFKQEYFPSALEERLLRMLIAESAAKEMGSYGWIPDPSSDDWIDYLQTPIYPADIHGFDGKNSEEREIYNATEMNKTANYKPSYRGSQAHAALDYEISTLLENEIQVILVGPPHHPSALEYVSDGQWDGVNETLTKYGHWTGVTVFDQTWASGWVDDHFYDRNHLDDEGRIEFCHRLAPVIEQILNQEVVEWIL